MSDVDDLIEELMVLEDPLHEKERRHPKVPKREMPFTHSDIKKAIPIIMDLIENHNMTPRKIREKVTLQVKWQPFWRINELLDKEQEIRMKGAKSKLRDQVGFIKEHTLYRPSSVTGDDEGGLMFKKVAKKYKTKSKPKSKSKSKPKSKSKSKSKPKSKSKSKPKSKAKSGGGKKKKRKNQRGGFYRELDIDYMRNWSNIHKERMDCCPCVFNLLGLDLDESNLMAEIYGQTGMKNEDILFTFEKMFPNWSFSFVNSDDTLNVISDNIVRLGETHIAGGQLERSKIILYENFFNQYQQYLTTFFKGIPKNHGVVGVIYFQERDYSHCVVFANVSGNLVLYDGQIKKSVIGLDNLTSYLIRNNVFFIQYLMGIGKATKENLSAPWDDAISKKKDPWSSSNQQHNTVRRNAKWYPSLFTDFPTDGVFHERVQPVSMEEDVFYDASEGYGRDVFYDASEGYR